MTFWKALNTYIHLKWVVLLSSPFSLNFDFWSAISLLVIPRRFTIWLSQWGVNSKIYSCRPLSLLLSPLFSLSLCISNCLSISLTLSLHSQCLSFSVLFLSLPLSPFLFVLSLYPLLSFSLSLSLSLTYTHTNAHTRSLLPSAKPFFLLIRIHFGLIWFHFYGLFHILCETYIFWPPHTSRFEILNWRLMLSLFLITKLYFLKDQ